MAGDQAIFHGGEIRRLALAALHGVRAARMEVAAGGGLSGLGTSPGKHDLLAPLVRVAGRAAENSALV